MEYEPAYALDRVAKVVFATHLIPVLASMGLEAPSSSESALYAAVCSMAVLDEFCSLLLSVRFGSADALLDIIGRVQADAFIDDKFVRTCNDPSDQGSSCWTRLAKTSTRTQLFAA